ncbi:Repressed by EFG1 protein 1 [Choanephora cucurbitarum]|uniref:Repressed by EFG1 protein 1 n=1 Tax=Choanephora cucurbitarum TaxID=101091 RepID=A0A1C7NRM4_9FUNG|nr:Repressed by EFG1 protein 1 [Choanephora cucurbitarum]
MFKSSIVALAAAFLTVSQAASLEGALERAVSSTDIATILNAHNMLRLRHSSPPLSWNNTLATFAEQWINKCQWAHSGGPYGENLALRTPGWNATVNAWYNEISLYNFSNPGFSSSTGHFTQVVWKATTQVGCAVRYCSNLSGNIYACEYTPRGNVLWGGTGDRNRFFRENVLPPK